MFCDYIRECACYQEIHSEAFRGKEVQYLQHSKKNGVRCIYYTDSGSGGGGGKRRRNKRVTKQIQQNVNNWLKLSQGHTHIILVTVL